MPDEYVNGRCVGEPVIEPCPMCNSRRAEDYADPFSRLRVTCPDCGYDSGSHGVDGRRSIAAHNAVYEAVRDHVKAIEQSEVVQRDWLSPTEAAGLKKQLAQTREEIRIHIGDRDSRSAIIEQVRADLARAADCAAVCADELSVATDGEIKWANEHRIAVSSLAAARAALEGIISATHDLLVWAEWTRRRQGAPKMNEPNTGAIKIAHDALRAARKVMP
jgi:hypothetical protein